MRILFVSACYLPTQNGVTYHIHLLKAALKKLGHQVFILAPQTSKYQDREENIIRYPSISNPGFPSYPIGIPLISDAKIKEISPQIIHTHHPFVAGMSAASIANKHNLPLFFTAHTQYEEYLTSYLPFFSPLNHQLIKYHLQQFTAKCKYVICPSSLAKDILSKYGITNSVIIPNGIDTENFIPQPSLKPNFLRLIFVGRIEKEKNPYLLISIAHFLSLLTSEFEMVIIGSGNLLPSLKQYSQYHKLNKHINFLENISRNKITAWYQSSHLFISPSKSEIMPLTFLEALNCGLPIITVKTSSSNRIFPPDPSIVLTQNSPRIIAGTIYNLFTNPDKLAGLSRSAVTLGKQFDISTTARKLENLYTLALGAKISSSSP